MVIFSYLSLCTPCSVSIDVFAIKAMSVTRFIGATKPCLSHPFNGSINQWKPVMLRGLPTTGRCPKVEIIINVVDE